MAPGELYKTTSGLKYHAGKLVIIIVGLPARNKSFIAQSLLRYLTWIGVSTRIFNLTEYRRTHFNNKEKNIEDIHFSSWYYDLENVESMNVRKSMIAGCLAELSKWLTIGNNQVAIYDATNINLEIRKIVLAHLPSDVTPIFLELAITDPTTIEHNLQETARYCPEYSGLGQKKAFLLMKTKLSLLEPYYQSVGYSDHEKRLSHIKLINLKSQFITHNLFGYLECHNSAIANSDSFLKLVSEQILPSCSEIWSSTSIDCVKVAKCLSLQPIVKSKLQHLDYGKYSPLFLTSDDEQTRLGKIKQANSTDYDLFMENPFYHRLCQAESYFDLSLRLENIIMELEGVGSDTVIVADETIIRSLYAYFAYINDVKIIPFINFPPGTIIQLFPMVYGTWITQYKWNSISSMFIQSEPTLQRMQ